MQTQNLQAGKKYLYKGRNPISPVTPVGVTFAQELPNGKFRFNINGSGDTLDIPSELVETRIFAEEEA